MDSSGAITEVEKEVPDRFSCSGGFAKDCREPRARARSSRVESLTKHATLVAYEAQVRKGSKTSEVQVGPDGGALAHEE